MNGLRHYLWKYKGLVVLNIIAIIIAAIFTVGMAFILQNIIDSTSAMDEVALFKAIGIGAIYMLLQMITTIVRRVLGAKFIQKTLVALKEDVFVHLLNKNIKGFNQENSATYISILSNDMKMLEDAYFYNMLMIFYQAVSFVIATVSMIYISPSITICVALVTILPISIPVLFGKKLSTSRNKYSEKLEGFTTKVKDYFNGFEVIKSFHIEEKTLETYRETNKGVEKTKFRMNTLMALVDSLGMVCGSMIFIVTIGMGSYFVIKGQMTMGLMIAAIQLMNHIVGPVTMIGEYMSQLKSVKGIEDKLMKIMESGIEEDQGIEKVEYTENIVFENVHFGYEEERSILNGINLSLEKGKKYAIVGGSGSGKSTILRLLMRYYENFEGTIRIDGIENRDIKISSLYNLLSVIHQDVFMFDDTIENNIMLYQNYSEEEIEKAIELSGLRPLIESHKEGKKATVGEDGNRLSGGEKQRIAIARALIKGTPIMVLDEATSSLDNETAYNIEQAILGIKDLTSLVVTHKLNAEILKGYDAIIVLKNGVVVEQGNFQELIEDRAYFYSLYTVMDGEKNNIV